MFTFITVVVPFPQVKRDEFHKQAALDIISILTNPISSTIIKVEAGDETRNTLLKNEYALKRVEQLPTLHNEQPNENLSKPPKNITQSPKVTENQDITQLPRVVDDLNEEPNIEFTKPPHEITQSPEMTHNQDGIQPPRMVDDHHIEQPP